MLYSTKTFENIPDTCRLGRLFQVLPTQAQLFLVPILSKPVATRVIEMWALKVLKKESRE